MDSPALRSLPKILYLTRESLSKDFSRTLPIFRLTRKIYFPRQSPLEEELPASVFQFSDGSPVQRASIEGILDSNALPCLALPTRERSESPGKLSPHV